MVLRQIQVSDQMRSLIFKLGNEDFKAQMQEPASTGSGGRNTIITQQINDLIIELMTDDETNNLREITQQSGFDMARQNNVRWYFSKTLSFGLRNILFIDESPFNIHIIRNHGWSRRGRTSNPIAIRGSVNTEVFNAILTTSMKVFGQAKEFILV
ncbi:hypothetical protein RF11_11002 [Thelohanellus kitauei]|uniref:Uncharacterized protein n=1 Tax=Thelohanellus kitauei TaxID=669202 RepID=A0A0C2J032_THEKT|nr:hypothetical protein RF11_11002 [Thelohanellus kitauei]